jgi:superkiller protein 3
LGNALADKGAGDAAIAQFQRALEIKPDSAGIHYNLGVVLSQQGKTDEAIAQYRKAVELDADHAAAQNSLGQALLLKGDINGAMACFERTAALSPDPMRRWFNLGNEFLQKGNWQAAILFYRRAIKINPRSADAWAYLGGACFKDGQSREAIDSWQKSLDLNPAQPQVQVNLASLLATAADPSLRDGAKAVALAGQANQAAGGGDPIILCTLAEAYAEAGRFAEASATARKALPLAQAQKNDKLAGALQEQIKLYDAGRPVRQAK